MLDQCSICGRDYDPPVRKYNNGNPIWISLPDCDCEAEQQAADFFAKFKAEKDD